EATTPSASAADSPTNPSVETTTAGNSGASADATTP
ncbi:hypothetical protein NPIL_457841, partial [Nephila pilipes]